MDLRPPCRRCLECWPARLLFVVALLLYVRLLASSLKEPPFFDDAYMYLRYAHHWLHARGIAWNPDGVQTYGLTSLPYLMVVTTARWLTSGPGHILLIKLSWSCGLLALVAMAAAVRQQARSAILRSPASAFALIAVPLMFHECFIRNCVTGMDTTLAMLCNALLCWATLWYPHTASPYRMAALCGSAYLAYAVRPDGGLYSVLLPSMYLFLHEHDRRGALRFLSITLTLLALDAGLKHAAFGHVLPLGAYVKRSGYYQGYTGALIWNPIRYLQAFTRAVAPSLGVLLFCARREHMGLLLPFLAPFSLTFLYFFSVVQIMGEHARYYVPSIPFIVVPAALVLDDLLAYPATALPRAGLLWRLCVAGILSCDAPFNFLEVAYDRHMQAARAPVRTVPLLTRAPLRRIYQGMAGVVSRLPAGTVVAASEVGLIGASAPEVTLIDLVALHDATIAREGFSMAYLESRRPDLIWMPHFHYTGLVRQILDHPGFFDRYDYYPGAFALGIAVRRDSPHYAAMQHALRAEWAGLYPDLDMESARAKGPIWPR
jgi:hypothetical protein